MNHFQIRDLLPRPVRELVFGVHDIRLLASSIGKSQTVESFMASKAGERAVEEAQLMIRGVLQTALFASGFYAIKFLGWSAVTTMILGTVLSTASMMIGASFFGLSYGARTLLFSIGTGSFFHFATGMTALAASYAALEHLEFFQIGFIERFVKQAAEFGAPHVIKNML